MASANIVVQHSIGRDLSAAEARRREALLKAIPKIDQHYARLRKMKLPEVDELSTSARKQALNLYNKVVADGRHIELLRTDPAAAAKKLGIKVSEEAILAIDAVASALRKPGTVMGPLEAVIAVVVVIAWAKPSEGIVIDEAANIRVRL